MMRKMILVVAVALLSACSAATDFEMPDGLYSLNGHLGDAVTVTLGTDGTGSLALVFDAALPTADDDATLLGYLTDNTITVSIANDATGTSANLTDGTRVDAAPTAAGQYYLTLDAARTTLTVQFYNETMGGAALQSGGAYTATITVNTNDYFVAEAFDVTATVL